MTDRDCCSNREFSRENSCECDREYKRQLHRECCNSRKFCLDCLSREYNRESDRESVSSMCCLWICATDCLGVSGKVSSVGIRHPCKRI